MASESLKSRSGRLAVIDIWPFLPTAFDHSQPGSAWPHRKGKVFGPLLAYFLWDKEEDDVFWVNKMKQVLGNLHIVALKEGCNTEDAPVYSNCALSDTPVEHVYRSNLKRLIKVRRKYDPEDIMGLAGGFKIPLPEEDPNGTARILCTHPLASLIVFGAPYVFTPDSDASTDSELDKVTPTYGPPAIAKAQIAAPDPGAPLTPHGENWDQVERLHLEGFYTYIKEAHLNSEDAGYTNFFVDYNSKSGL